MARPFEFTFPQGLDLAVFGGASIQIGELAKVVVLRKIARGGVSEALNAKKKNFPSPSDHRGVRAKKAAPSQSMPVPQSIPWITL